MSDTVERKILGGLINSISRFVHLVACQCSDSFSLKEMKNMASMLKLLKHVLDEAFDCQPPSDELLLKAFEDLDASVNEAREIIETLPLRISRICNVLRCEPLVMKVQDFSVKICDILTRLLQSSSFPSLLTSVQQCLQELQYAEHGHISEYIDNALRDQRNNVMPDPKCLMKIADPLGLTSQQELLGERITLEKERLRFEVKNKSGDARFIGELIELVSHITNQVGKQREFRMIKGVPLPSCFCCPLALGLMLDPVILASGQTFERSFIQKWLDNGLRICPVTRQELSNTNLVANDALKVLIANWCKENRLNLSQMKCSSFHQSSGRTENFYSGHSFHSAQRYSSEGQQEHPQIVTDVLCQNNGLGDPLTTQQELMPGKAFDSSNQYTHFRSDSISSVNSTTELLRKSGNKKILSECSISTSDKNIWFSDEETHSTPGNNTRTGRLPVNPSSGFDATISSFHVQKLVEDLRSQMNELETAAAAELRLLAKNNMDNRVLIAKYGAIAPLVSLLYSKVKETQENAITALLNLSINDHNKILIAEAGAIEASIYVLKFGSTEAKENAAATLFSLSTLERYKAEIGCTEAIKVLVNLLGSGTLRGRKDAATALFSLSILHENKARMVQAGAVKYLVELLDPETCMVDKAVALLANLSTVPEGRLAVAHEGGIPLLVEIVESGTPRGKENAASTLFQLCIHSQKFSNLVLQEGAVPPLVSLSQLGTPRAKEKAQQILSHFRSQREGGIWKGKS